ncbi:MAG: cupin domain-containing protein [Nitrospirae bacterium]|nr:cupin domain-containing protein [Nitrospirota bacterium]
MEKIAHALNTRTGYFFGNSEHRELIFVRKGRDKRAVHKDKKAVCETLASGFLNINVQPQIFTLPPDCELAMELTSSVGDKFGIALKGKLEFLCDEEKLVFEEGDSIYSTYTQKIQKATNIGETEAKLLWIVFRYP